MVKKNRIAFLDVNALTDYEKLLIFNVLCVERERERERERVFPFIKPIIHLTFSILL